MLKDVTDSSRDEGCYGYSKTDAHTDRCHGGHLQELGSGAVDRWVIIIAILHLLIRVSLILFPSLVPVSFPSPHLVREGDKLICWMKSAHDCQDDVVTIMRRWVSWKNMKRTEILEKMRKGMTKSTVSSLQMAERTCLSFPLLGSFRLSSFIMMSSISLHLCFNMFS